MMVPVHDEDRSMNDLRFRWLGSTRTELSLCRLQDEVMINRSIQVFMLRIGPSSCEFQTYMDIPVRDDAQWLMKQQMGSYTAFLHGIIVSSVQVSGWWKYEMKWTMSKFAQQIYEYRLNAYMQKVLVDSPHILTLYRAINERNDEQSPQIDVST